MIKCPLCGYGFAREEGDRCSVCPMNRNCGVICCPNCGYQFVEDSWVVEKWRSLKCIVGFDRTQAKDSADAP